MTRFSALLAMVVAVACEQAPQPTAATASASASASAAAVPAPSASTPPVRPRVAPATQPGCRVLSLKGEVKGPSGPVPNGGVLYGTEWLELGKGSELSLRHTGSTRELTVKGPGKALPCLDGDEEVLLVEGTIETGSGAGARPGAEVVIYTSFGTVSYGDAQIAIRASKGRIEIASSKGEAWIRPTRGVTRKGPEKLVGGNDKATLTAAVRPEAALQDCERAAGEAESLGRAVFSPAPADGGTLGDRAAAHLVARKTARAACGSARVGIAGEADAEKRKGLEDRLAKANQQWQAVGPPGSPAAKSSAP